MECIDNETIKLLIVAISTVAMMYIIMSVK